MNAPHSADDSPEAAPDLSRNALFQADPRPKQRHTALAILFLSLCITAYLAFVGTYAAFRHAAFKTQAFDLGIFDQALWLVSQGKDPFITVRGLHRFGDHIEFILYLLAPLYWVWDSVYAAIWSQSLVIALGSVPVFLLARQALGNIAAVVFAIAYLLNPSVQNLNLDHVHAEAYGGTALLFSFYFAVRKHYLLMFIFSFLAMLCKEDVALTTGALGLFVALKQNMRAGSLLALISAGWFILSMKILLPFFNDVGFFRFHGGWFAGFYANKLDAAWYISTLFKKEVATYLLDLFAPLGFLSLLCPLVALIAGPAILVNILSDTGYLRSINYHYMATITPFLIAAAVCGAARLIRHPPKLWLPSIRVKRVGRIVGIHSYIRIYGPLVSPRIMKVLVLCLILASSLVANISLSHYTVDKALPEINSLMNKAGDAKADALAAAMAMIPAHAIVSADYIITPHLTHREKIYMFPNPFRADNWGVNDENQHDPETVQYILVQDEIVDARQRNMLDFLVSSAQFEVVFSRKGVHLYKRVATWSFEVPGPTEGHGLMGYFFAFDHDLSSLPQAPQGPPEQILLIPQINFPVSSGEFKTDNVSGTQLRRRFMAIFDGFLNAPAAGEYSFTVYSDDGFRFQVDNRTVCEFPVIRAFGPTYCKSTLKKGPTAIRLQYFNNAPPHGLQLMWQTPEDSEPKVIESSYFYPSEQASLN